MKDRFIALAQEFHQTQKLAEEVRQKNQRGLAPLLVHLRRSRDPKFYLLNENRTDFVSVKHACLQEFVTVAFWNEHVQEGTSEIFTVVVGDPNSTPGVWKWVEKIKNSGK